MSTRRLVLGGLSLALVIVGILSFYASGHPDGLEYVAGQLGFADSARPAADAPLADYQVPGLPNGRLSGGLAGVMGALIVLITMMLLVKLMRRKPSR